MPLQDLPETEAQAVRSRAASLAGDIANLSQSLTVDAQARQALSGQLLRLALQHPEDADIWSVDGRPVLVNWGFAPGSVGAQPQDLTRLGGILPPPPPVAPTPVAAIPAPARGGCLPWLLPLLLLLLLLWLLGAALGLLPSPLPAGCMASIDIGGGTTDLSITTFELASGEGDTARIKPHTEFRDGFNIAGDEVLREVVANHVIPAIGQALIQAGLTEPRALLGQLFGRDSIGMSQEDRNTRVRLVRQIAVPVALGLLGTCENPELRGANFRCTLSDFFEADPVAAADLTDAPLAEDTEEATAFRPASPAPRPQPATLREVESMVRRSAPFIQNFNILDVPITITPAAVEETIRATLGPTLSALCEVVHMYDCDALLLTGRPSSWNGVIATVLAKLPVPPDRIIPMRRYHAGSWYPFADARGRITDPKTTVVVGAILCALADGHLEGFSFDSGALKLTSTARYIGEMDINSQLKRPKVWFTVDVNSKDGTDKTRSVAFSGPISIGYRQLDAERWPTTRYHLLAFASEEARSRASGRLPYKVEVSLSVADALDDDDIRSETDKDRRSEGEFRIDSIVDYQDRSVDRRDLEIRLQTLKLDEGYWLDTGIVTDAG